jgi:hypothetical protein
MSAFSKNATFVIPTGQFAKRNLKNLAQWAKLGRRAKEERGIYAASMSACKQSLKTVPRFIRKSH